METKKYFLQLLSSYINNEIAPKPDADIDWDELFRLAKIHSVQYIIFRAVDTLSIKPPIYDKLKNAFILSVNASTVQEVWMEKVINALTENNIDHTLIKGYVLRNYYPDKEARTFGDIDFLIDEADRAKSDEVIKGIGFEYDKEHYIKDVWTYKKGVTSLEVHTNIIYEDLFNDVDYIGYFKEKVKNKQLISGNTYELKKEDHFIYILVHLAKHFYNAGVGIRMFMDIAVFLNKFGDSLDFVYINSEAEKIKLPDFLNTVYFICKKYFKTNISCNPIDKDNEYLIMEYVINHGVFGFDDKDVTGIGFHKRGEATLTIYLKRIFPNYETMQKHYDWFSTKPKIMLPYAWVRRWIFQIVNPSKRHSIVQKIDSASHKSTDVYKHKKMLEITGLKNREK